MTGYRFSRFTGEPSGFQSATSYEEAAVLWAERNMVDGEIWSMHVSGPDATHAFRISRYSTRVAVESLQPAAAQLPVVVINEERRTA